MKKFCLASRLLTALLLVSITGLLHAQDNSNSENLLKEFKRLQENYGKDSSSILSFDVSYVYSDEKNPDKILDSLSGRMEVSQNNYRCILDSTETISNDKITIMLFKQDRVMYLTKRTKNSFGADPLALLDTFLTVTPDITCEIKSLRQEKILSLNFPDNNAYKKIEFTIDTARGYLTKAIYIVKTELLTDAHAVSNNETEYSEYAKVESTFFNYKREKKNEALFDENTFFHKENGDYKTTDAYKDYQIFIATPNL